jgi:elongation factor P
MEDLKVGKKILVDGNPFEVIKSEHLKVAMGKGMVKSILLNLLTGATVPRTFREVDKFEDADITYATTEFQYSDADAFHFMNVDTFETIDLSVNAIGDRKYFLVEGDRVIIMEWNGRPINVELGPVTVLTVTETQPGERGDTATGGKKPATLSTGLTVQVPLFIKVGDRLRVDTRTHEYLSRTQE